MTEAKHAATDMSGPLSVVGEDTSSDGQIEYAVSSANNDIANFDDYGGGRGGDDAEALRLAIASGKQTIYVPPGNYTFKSVVQQWGTAVDPTFVELQNVDGVTIQATGATFRVADNIAGSTPVCAMAFSDNSKDDSLIGATFVDSNAGLPEGAENVAVGFDSVTALKISHATITGSTTAAVAGVYGFDCQFDNITATDVAIGFDISHIDNLAIQNCEFTADAAIPVAGLTNPLILLRRYRSDSAALCRSFMAMRDGSGGWSKRSVCGGVWGMFAGSSVAFMGLIFTPSGSMRWRARRLG